MNYDDEYFLFIDITYFDNYIEKFFIQVSKLKENIFFNPLTILPTNLSVNEC